MKKRMLVLLLFAITLSGCEKSTKTEDIRERFVTIATDWYGTVVYDTKTGVEYYRNSQCCMLLVDKDGKPLIYEGE